MYALCGCALLWAVPFLQIFSLTPLPPSPCFSTHILISSTFTSYGMQYYRCSVILFSFPSFPEFHRVVTLLQTCSTTEHVYDHACFCVYVSLWIYLSHMRQNMGLLSF
jgi:hypothetical protein